MKTYLITAAHETSRSKSIADLKESCPFDIQNIEAIYPSRSKLPFRDELISASKKRIGRELLMGELGCLMSHRKAWQQLVKELNNEEDHALILESDSALLDSDSLKALSTSIQKEYDLFFWGAWEGHMKLFRSTKKKSIKHYTIGEPFIRTVYCTYGYSLNKKAARLLLERTRRISHPVDQFKYFFGQKELRLGGILPEVITGNAIGSTIRSRESAIMKAIFLNILDIKNTLICACH